jgi:hypothetical protein
VVTTMKGTILGYMRYSVFSRLWRIADPLSGPICRGGDYNLGFRYTREQALNEIAVMGSGVILREL